MSSTDKNIIYPELSYQIMQAVYEVHNTLGPGFIESVYEQALAYEFESGHIPYQLWNPSCSITTYCQLKTRIR